MVDSFTVIDLIAASTNAFMGALLALSPTHNRKYTVVGIILLGIAGGIGGGTTRDIILNKIPGAFENPLYIILCILTSVLALVIAYRTGLRVKLGIFRFIAAFSLPWYSAVGVQAALTAGLAFFPSILIGIIASTAGRMIIDLVSGVTPLQFVKGEWFVGTAVLSSVVYYLCYAVGLSIWPATLIALAVGFTFRIASMSKHWEEPGPWESREAIQKEKKEEKHAA
jgi:uncharacterized membrane protein YeiH